jgi:glycosyltransferase involved in cell wall biosynthesis
MKRLCRQPIALLSIAKDPAVEKRSVDADQAICSISSLAEALTKLGWHVDIFTRKTQPNQPKLVQHSPYCRTVYLEAGPPQPLDSDQLLEYLPQLVKDFQTFQTEEGTNYPLVHTCDWISGRVGLRLKELHHIQLIHSHSESQDNTLTCQTRQMTCVQGGKGEPVWWSQLADAQLMTEWELWQQADQVTVVRTSALADSIDYHAPADAKAKLGFQPTDRIVLYVGSLDADSGLETLIQAFAQCCDRYRDRATQAASRYPAPQTLRLVLIGDRKPSQWQPIEQQLNGLQLSELTQFVADAPPERRSLYYAAADVCVIPSRYEAFGSVALEALAHGTPVVASNVGGLKFVVVSEETGLLVPPHDATAFAEAIDRVLSNELWAKRLKRQATGQLDPWLSTLQVAAQLSDLYRRLLAYFISQDQRWMMQKPYILKVPGAAVSNSSIRSTKASATEIAVS